MSWADDGVPMSCSLCRQPCNSHLRAQWGCDAETAEPVLHMECWECDGANQDCATCGGTNVAALHRCPWQLVDATALEVCTYANLLETGILPVTGGLRDQAAMFVDGLKYVLRQRRRYEDMKKP